MRGILFPRVETGPRERLVQWVCKSPRSRACLRPRPRVGWPRVALLGVTMLVLAWVLRDAADEHQIAQPRHAGAASPSRVTYTYELWKWAWVAAMVTGVIVWGLIAYAVVKFRRRSDDEVPRADALQPAAGGLLHDRPGASWCIVFFFHTVTGAGRPEQDDRARPRARPDRRGRPVSSGQWTFNHGVGEQNRSDATPN